MAGISKVFLGMVVFPLLVRYELLVINYWSSARKANTSAARR
jgi:hypothetical protein